MAIERDEMKIYVDKRNSWNSSQTKENLWSGDKSTRSVSGGTSYTYRRGKRRPKPQYLDPAPYELRLEQIQGAHGSWSVTEGGRYTSRFIGGLAGGSPHVAGPYGPIHFGVEYSTQHDTNLEDLSRVSALSKLNHKDVDIGTAFAEAGKTAQLLGDVAHLSVDLLNAARKRDALGFIRRLTGNPDVSHRLPAGQNVLDTYLAYHYGVKPALQEIAGAVQTITRLPPEQWRVRAVGEASYDRELHDLIVVDSCALNASSSLVQSCRTQISATRRKISRGDDLRWALGLDDPLSTVWELTPFSFVYDWAMPIGDWLSAINASKYYTDWSVSSTLYTKVEASLRGTKFSERDVWGRSFSYDGGSVQGAYKLLRITRNVSNVIPITTLPVKRPVSVDHMAKGLSLFATALARAGEVPRFLRY